MTSLTTILTNPEALSMYDVVPSLEQVELLNLRFNRGLSDVELDLSIRDLPTRPPQRWAEGVNAVAMTLQFSDILAASMNQASLGAKPIMVGCSFRKTSEGFLFDCDGSGLNLWVECNHARLTHLNGYRRESGDGA